MASLKGQVQQMIKMIEKPISCFLKALNFDQGQSLNK